jgi:hypothetical protein
MTTWRYGRAAAYRLCGVASGLFRLISRGCVGQ